MTKPNEIYPASRETKPGRASSIGELAAAFYRDLGGYGREISHAPLEAKPYSDERVVGALIEFQEYENDLNSLGESSTILYPGSSCDETLAKVFGGIVHIDPDENAMDVMKKNGYKTSKSTIEEYVKNMSEGECVDLVFSFNSGKVPLELLDKIRAGGYVIANNWHGSANDLGEKPEFEVVCAIDPRVLEKVDSKKAKEALGVTETEYGEMEKFPDVLWLFKKVPSKEE